LEYNLSSKFQCLLYFIFAFIYVDGLFIEKLKIILPLTFILYIFLDNKYIELQYINYFYTDEQIIYILNNYRYNYEYLTINNVSKLSNVRNKYLKIINKFNMKQNYSFYKKKLIKYPEIEEYITKKMEAKYLKIYAKKYSKFYLLCNIYYFCKKYKYIYYFKKLSIKKVNYIYEEDIIYYILKK
jgi:hypothetical protein